MSSIDYINIKCGSWCENCDSSDAPPPHKSMYLDNLQRLEKALSLLESEIHKTLLIGFHHVLTQTFFDVSSFRSKLPKDVSLLLVGTPTDRQKMQELRDFFSEHDVNLIFSDFIGEYTNEVMLVADSNCHPIQVSFEDAPPRGAAPGHGELLTPKEETVLKLLITGLTNREIAKFLFLSIRTIESHRYHLQNKLGAHSRSQLIRAATSLNFRFNSSQHRDFARWFESIK